MPPALLNQPDVSCASEPWAALVDPICDTDDAAVRRLTINMDDEELFTGNGLGCQYLRRVNTVRGGKD
jgi:hypothetical protein